MPPTAGMPRPAAERAGQRVVAPAAGDRRQVGRARAAARRRRSRRSTRAWSARSSPRTAASPASMPARRQRVEPRREAVDRRLEPRQLRARAPRSSASARGAAARPPAPPRCRATSRAVERRRRRLRRPAARPAPPPPPAPRSPTARRAAAISAARPALGLGGEQLGPRRAGGRVPVAEALRAARGTAPAARRGGGAPPCARALVAERVDRREHQADVAGDELDRRVAERRDDQPQHLGVVRRRVAGLEDLEARLQVLPRPVRARLLPPPDRPAVDVARRLGAGVHVQPHDRHGEVGAQHHLRALVAGDEGAGADVLAVEVEQHVGGLQRRRLDPHRAGRAERRRGCAPPRPRAGRAPAPMRAPLR